MAGLHDKFGRAITDLRISITDRCNYKCVYCRTGNEGALYGDLPFEDYLRMARVLVGMGITKVRLTGGEPLLRKGVVRDLCASWRSLRNGRQRSEPLDIALTTNGHLLAELAQPLKDAGLDSRHGFDGRSRSRPFARITRVPNGYDTCWPASALRAEPGLAAESQLRADARLQRRPDHSFRHVRARRRSRPCASSSSCRSKRDRIWAPSTVVTLDEILARMAEYRPLVEIPHAALETARRYRFEDGVGEIGIIAPVSHPFCGHCSRIRITSDGKIRTCLFSVWDHDLHAQMRRGASDESWRSSSAAW